MNHSRRPLIPLSKFPEHLHKFLSPEAPAAAVGLIVRGMLPLEGAIKVCALYQAAHLNESLYDEAGIALGKVPEDQLIDALTQLPPPILDWVAERCQSIPAIAAAILAHSASAMSTLVRLLSSAPSAVAERLADNQVKLLSDPTLLQSLCLNSALPELTRDRLLELARFQSVDLSWLEVAQAQRAKFEEETLRDAQAQRAKLEEETLRDAQAQRNAQKGASAQPDSSPLTPQADTSQSPSTSQANTPQADTSRDSASQESLTSASALKAPAKSSASPLSLVGEESRAPTPERLAWDALSIESFPEQVRRFLSPDAPEAALNVILNGLLPMSADLRLCSLFQLWTTRTTVRARAAEASRTLNALDLSDVFRRLSYPAVLDWGADMLLGAHGASSPPSIEGAEELVGQLSLNEYAAGDTIARVALYTSAQGCERLAQNQQRLIAAPQVVHALYYNPNLSSATADRVLEFAAREGLDLSWLPEADSVLSAIHDGASGGPGVSDEALREAINAPEEVESEASALVQAVLSEHAARREAERGDNEDGKPLKGYALIQSLNVAQKIRLALLGSQSDRALLVRDSNKVVARAAIRSPAVSVSEALLYARNHSLKADIIEYIANNRKWMQNYRVKVQVVLNPKTPVNISLNALNTLRPAELRSVAQSHSVSGVVSARAKQIIKRRQG